MQLYTSYHLLFLLHPATTASSLESHHPSAGSGPLLSPSSKRETATGTEQVDARSGMHLIQILPATSTVIITDPAIVSPTRRICCPPPRPSKRNNVGREMVAVQSSSEHKASEAIWMSGPIGDGC